MKFINKEEVDYICKLLFTSNKIPITVIDDKGNLLSEFPEDNKLHSIISSEFGMKEQLMLENQTRACPFFHVTPILENFFSIQFPLNSEQNGIILVGPVLYTNLPDETINSLVYDLQLDISKEQMIQYYQTLPIISNMNFINMSMIFYYMLFQKPLDLVKIVQENQQLDKEKIDIESPTVQIAEQRQNTRWHHDPLEEKKAFDCIKLGKKAELIEVLKSYPEKVNIGILSKKSHLRSQKNLAIAGITIATRAAVEGGLYPEIAFTLSDLFIQKLEDLVDSNSVQLLIENALMEFTDRVEQSNKNKFTKPIYRCQNYIFTHIYEDITLPHLAEVTTMNPSYLSALFKKEVGMSISEYIQRAKVDEAISLIHYTSHSLKEISSLLNFHDQSHFTKSFKKFAGVTPKQFKRGLVEA